MHLEVLTDKVGPPSNPLPDKFWKILDKDLPVLDFPNCVVIVRDDASLLPSIRNS
jgi:hypothetical protein